MIVKHITSDIDLHLTSLGLSIYIGEKEVISGFSDVGILANGLLPIIYFDERRLLYLDIDSKEIFEISGVDWVSGLHFVGSDLNYFGLNFRSDFDSNRLDSFECNVFADVQGLFDDLVGFSVDVSKKRSFNEDEQKFIELVNTKISASANDFSLALKEIKYLRIVGCGQLGKSINLGAANVRSEDGGVYHPRQFVLTGDAKYGVMDVRSNKLVVPCEFKQINVFHVFALTERGIQKFS